MLLPCFPKFFLVYRVSIHKPNILSIYSNINLYFHQLSGIHLINLLIYEFIHCTIKPSNPIYTAIPPSIHSFTHTSIHPSIQRLIHSSTHPSIIKLYLPSIGPPIHAIILPSVNPKFQPLIQTPIHPFNLNLPISL